MSTIDELVVRIRAARERIGEVGASFSHSRSKAAELRDRFSALGAEGKSSRTAEIDTLLEEQQARIAVIERQAESAQARADALRRGTGSGRGGSPPSGSGAAPVQGPARNGVKPPNAQRHVLARISERSKTGEENTVILPNVDIEADLDAIRNGRAKWNPDTDRYSINGRTWAVKANGTSFPCGGEGLVTMTRTEYKALTGLVQCGGDMERRPPKLMNNPSISSEDWSRAAQVYRYHPQNGHEKS